MTILAEIDGIHREDTSTTTFYLQDKTRYNRTDQTNWNWEHWPIIKSFELDSSFKENIISKVQGRIVIDISPNSYGYQRRFIDLLDKYEITNQRIELIDIFRGKVTNYKANYAANELIINCSLELYNEERLNYALKRSQFASLRGNAGKVPVPFVLGSDQLVKPVYFQTTSTTHYYGYNTILQNTTAHFNSGGVQNYYVKDFDGKYKEFESATTTSTVYSGYDLDGNEDSYIPSVLPSGSSYHRARGYDINPTSDGNPLLIYGGFVNVYDQDTDMSSQTGEIILSIRKKEDGLPGQVIASASRDISDYSWNGSGINKIEFAFDSLVPLVDETVVLYFEIKLDSVTTSINVPEFVRDAARVDSTTIYEEITDTGQIIASTDDNPYYAGIHGCTLSDAPNGFGSYADTIERKNVAYFTIATPTSFGGKTPGSGTTLNNAFYVKVDGIKDNTSGTITGTASKLLEEVDEVYSLLLATRDSSSYWVPRSLETSRFSSGNSILSDSDHFYFRKVGGASHNFTTRTRILKEISRETSTFLYMDADYTSTIKPVLYTWGEELDISATFTDEDSRIEDLTYLDLRSVINRAKLVYGRNFRDIEFDNFLFGLVENYDQYENEFSDGHDDASDFISGTSFDIYGERINRREQINYLSDSASIDTFIRFILTNFDRPAALVKVVRPELQPSVRIMQGVSLVFPQLPAYYGTSATLFNKESGTAQTYPQSVGTRSQRYRGQVYGVKSRFENGEKQETEYLIRLLIHEHDPT